MDEDGLDALQVPFACSRLQGENQKDMSFRGKTLSSHLVRALPCVHVLVRSSSLSGTEHTR